MQGEKGDYQIAFLPKYPYESTNTIFLKRMEQSFKTVSDFSKLNS